MSGALVAVARGLRAALAGFDPAVLSGVDCAVVVEELALTEKACAAGRVSAGVRALDCGAHRASGVADGVEWLARQAGTTRGDARLALETVAAVEACPQTRQALVAGQVSLAQAREITQTAIEVPGSEPEMLAVAQRSGLSALRDAARARRAAAVDAEDLYRRQHRARQFRYWRDELGMVRVNGTLLPHVGVPFVNRLDAETDRVRRAARAEGAEEPRAAHAADAFAALVAGAGRGHATRADLVIVSELGPFRRGHALPGEVCHIVGGGPVPVGLARELSQDAFIKAVLHDGVNIHTVAHYGRHINAELRTALELGAPPDFDGAACVNTDCGRRYGLEWDHLDPVAHHGPTSYDNLVARCWDHHLEKTEQDRAAGLLGPNPPGPAPPPPPPAPATATATATATAKPDTDPTAPPSPPAASNPAPADPGSSAAGVFDRAPCDPARSPPGPSDPAPP